MAATPETRVKKKIKEMLTQEKRWYSAISDRYHSGLPDFIAVGRNGEFVAIEAKAAGKKPEPIQEEIGRRIERSGGRYAVICPGKEKGTLELGILEADGKLIWFLNIIDLTTLANLLFA